MLSAAPWPGHRNQRSPRSPLASRNLPALSHRAQKPWHRISLAVLEQLWLSSLPTPAVPSSQNHPRARPQGKFLALSVNNWNSVIQSHEDSSYHLSLAFLLNILTPTTIRASCKSPLKSLELALRFLQRLLPHRDDKQPAFPKTQPDPFRFWTKIHPPGSPCPRSVLAATSRSCARSCVPLPRAAHSQGWHFTGSAAF